MKKSELIAGTKILEGLKFTPDDWGDRFIIIDKEGAVKATLDCGFSYENGEELMEDLEIFNQESDIYIVIVKVNDKFYAYDPDDDGYYECYNPNECETGLLCIGKYYEFDLED